MGKNQSEDILCWRDPENPKYVFGADVTDDGKVYCECLYMYLFSE
jgi:prolyl oligopeptidase